MKHLLKNDLPPAAGPEPLQSSDCLTTDYNRGGKKNGGKVENSNVNVTSA